MHEEPLSKRELIKNVLLAATGAGLSAAMLQQAVAQTPGPTASPPVVNAPVGPTPMPQGTNPRAPTTDRAASPPKAPASKAK